MLTVSLELRTFCICCYVCRCKVLKNRKSTICFYLINGNCTGVGIGQHTFYVSRLTDCQIHAVFSREDVYDSLMEVIKRSQAIEITVRVVKSDTGQQNRSIWRNLHIVGGRHAKQ